MHLRPVRHWTERRVRGHIAVCVYAAVIEALIAHALIDADLRDPDLPDQHLSAARALRELGRVRAVTLDAGGRTVEPSPVAARCRHASSPPLGVDTSQLGPRPHPLTRPAEPASARRDVVETRPKRAPIYLDNARPPPNSGLTTAGVGGAVHVPRIAMTASSPAADESLGTDTMTAFISYARRDEAVAVSLHSDVERAVSSAFMDRDIEGGQLWWDVILERIRACELFVFAVSPDALLSRACQAELSYAVALGRTVLPVLVRTVNLENLPESLGRLQIVDYRTRTPESAMALTLAVSHAAPAGPPPDPLPIPPPAPMASLGPCRDAITRASLSYEDQVNLLNELRQHGDNPDERTAVLGLLQQLRSRADIVESVALDAKALIERLAAQERTERQTDDGGGSPRARRGESLDLLRSLMTHSSTGRLTPILGLGVTDSLVGSARELTEEWARLFEFPADEREPTDLAQVAQFIAVMSDETTLRSSLVRYLEDQIARRFPAIAAEHRNADLRDVLRAAWDAQRTSSAADPHMVVASLPCPIFITAHPANLLADALTVEGKEPVVDLCRWRPGVYDWPESPLSADPGYVPSVERPLVFHIFGHAGAPDSLVLTEDDFLGYLISVTEDKSLVPLPVRGALADSSLLLLGVELDTWAARILLLTLINREGAFKLQRYTHVAAQVAPGQNVTSPERARRYLERYFSKVRRPAIDIYWGTVSEFVADLAAMRSYA